MLKKLIYNKCTNTNPTYGTIQDLSYNQIPRINTFPYPFYFVSNPLSDYPSVNERRSGWSPELIYRNDNSSNFDEDDGPKHCFQSACNTTFTYTKNECKKERNDCGCDNKCKCGCNEGYKCRCNNRCNGGCGCGSREKRKSDDCSKCKEDVCINLFR